MAVTPESMRTKKSTSGGMFIRLTTALCGPSGEKSRRATDAACSGV